MTEPAQNGTAPSIGAPKRVKTGGRKKGTPNKLTDRVRKDAGAFFRQCTSENVKFRKQLKAFCESGEVLKHSHTLAVLLSHALGKPTPKVEQGEAKPPLLFITLADPLTGAARPLGYDPLQAKAAELAARKAARALPEKTAEKFEPPKPDAPEGEALEVVDPGALASTMIRPAGR